MTIYPISVVSGKLDPYFCVFSVCPSAKLISKVLFRERCLLKTLRPSQSP